MLGAIIGDLAGSIYEFEQVKKHSEIQVDNIIEDTAFRSDETILTIAIADAIINHKSYEDCLKKYAIDYENKTPTERPYFKTMFSPGFIAWAKGDKPGTSIGNGAMMRISPVGYLFDTEEDVTCQSYLATSPSHNTLEAIAAAKTIALIILYARKGFSKQEIISKLDLKIKKPIIDKFNYTCSDTIDVCLYLLFNSKNFISEYTKRLGVSI